MEEKTKKHEIAEHSAQDAQNLSEHIKRIANDDELTQAAGVLSRIHDRKKEIKEAERSITDPIRQSLENARSMFRPYHEEADEAERRVKDEIKRYQTHKIEAVQTKKEKLASRVERGTLKPETAARKMEEVEEPELKSEHHYTRVDHDIRIADETQIPREYLVPDYKKIRQAVLKEGAEVPGVEVEKDYTIVVK